MSQRANADGPPRREPRVLAFSGGNKAMIVHRAATNALRCILALLLFLLPCACAKDEKPRHASHRKWYQGDMDNSDRSFYIDSFFDGR